MKTYLILIALLTSTIAITAQVEKGVKLLEGNLSFSVSERGSYYYHYQQYKTQRLAINPKIGWFVSQSSVLGVGVGFDYSEFEPSNSIISESKEHLFSFNPYFRNYQQLADKLYYTTTVSFALGFGKEKRGEDFKIDIFTINLNARPGLCYFISDKWALKTSFGSLYYSKTKKKVTDGSEEIQPEIKDKDFGLNFSMDSFSLGLGYYF